MKKTNFAILVIIAFATFFMSCSKDKKIEEDILIDVKEIVTASQSLINDFKNSSLFSNIMKSDNKILNLTLDYNTASLVSYFGTSGRGLIISYKTNTDYEIKYLIIFLDKTLSSFENGMIYYRNENNNTVEVIDLNEENKLIIEYDPEGYSFIKISKSTIKSAKTTADMEAWMECMECAITSCLSDWVCAVGCAAVYPECIGAIGIACIFSPISCS